jgi:hypothetical protein
MKRVAQVVLIAGGILLAASVLLGVLTYGFFEGSGPPAMLLVTTVSLAVPMTLVGGALLLANYLLEKNDQRHANDKVQTEADELAG